MVLQIISYFFISRDNSLQIQSESVPLRPNLDPLFESSRSAKRWFKVYFFNNIFSCFLFFSPDSQTPLSPDPIWIWNHNPGFYVRTIFVTLIRLQLLHCRPLRNATISKMQSNTKRKELKPELEPEPNKFVLLLQGKTMRLRL
jgi:hypothetical protein